MRSAYHPEFVKDLIVKKQRFFTAFRMTECSSSRAQRFYCHPELAKDLIVKKQGFFTAFRMTECSSSRAQRGDLLVILSLQRILLLKSRDSSLHSE